jgi:methionyl aminopeptidase
MILLKTREEIEIMRQSAQLVSKTLGVLAPLVKPGVTPLQLDKLAEEYIRDNGGIPGFLGLYDFPNTLCMSRNEHVVHGYPNAIPLREGDIISVDCGVILNGYYGDQAYTFEVGEVKPEIKKLLRVTKESLYKGIAKCRAGNRIGDVGYAVQKHAEAHGYGVVRELVGHGLGKSLHEEPQVPNYGKPGKGKLIENGLVIAIEPMINLGTARVKQLRDGWSIVTGDGKASAHFEHDVAVIDGKPDVLSTFDYIHTALGLPLDDINQLTA